MTLMPSRHVRDPRQRYRANRVRKRIRPSIPLPVVYRIPTELIDGLVSLPGSARTQALRRLEAEKGSEYTVAVLSAVAAALREKRQK